MPRKRFRAFAKSPDRAGLDLAAEAYKTRVSYRAFRAKVPVKKIYSPTSQRLLICNFIYQIDLARGEAG